MSPWHQTQLTRLLSATVFFSSAAIIKASDTCQPVTWADDLARRDTITSIAGNSTAAATSTTSSVIATPTLDILGSISTGDVQPGAINCRYAANTYDDANYYTCTSMADKYEISLEDFFTLNPTLDPDCGNIQTNTIYCVSGFIEPVRATDGLCGPSNNYATCIGYSLTQCCNSETWTCGNSTEDCAPGTCYEGICPGDQVYSTDGTCGYQHGNRLCAGKWGDCCDMNGQCGTGSAFCGIDVCQMGNCTLPEVVLTIPSWAGGNTTDGTCGPANSYSCSNAYGSCCNKDGICGSLVSDCGVGCQPDWGNCNTVNTSLSSSTTSSTSSSSSSSSSVAVTSSTSKSSVVSSTSSAGTTSKPSSTSAKSSTTASAVITAISGLPSCGQTCFNNVIAQYSTLGCASPDPSCLCSNVNFGYGIRDCSNGACGTDVASTVIAFESAYCASAAATVKSTTSASSTVTGIASLPSCGQTCFNNVIAQYSALGCASPDPSCLCSNVNFGYGIRDCSNGACGTDVASTVIAFESAYCASAAATVKATATTTGFASLPSCGQLCFNNMVAMYSALGCATPDPYCLCNNANFGFGLRDCSNGACGSDVGSTAIAYGSAYCASASATATAK